MARILSKDERFTLTVEERGTAKCETCDGQGSISKPIQTVCPVCGGTRTVPSEKVDATVVYELAPLGWLQKQEVLGQTVVISGQQFSDDARQAWLCMKYSVKGVKGVVVKKGDDLVPWEPAFGKDGNITDDSLEDLLNCTLTGPLTETCRNLLSGIPKVVVDRQTGLQRKGCRIDLAEAKKKEP
jgi:hypothetical protein